MDGIVVFLIANLAFLGGGGVVWYFLSRRCTGCLMAFYDRPDGMNMTDFFLLGVSEEITSARKKHPGNSHLTVALMEEVGELAKAHLENEGSGRIWAEARQVACVAARIALENDGDFEWKCRDTALDGDSDSLPLTTSSRAHVLAGIRAGRATA